MTTIAITGASGRIGGPLVDLLRAHPELDVRVASRRAPAAGSSDGHVSAVRFDWQQPDGADELVAGAHILVVIPPSGLHPLATTEVLLERARTSGVRHVIFLSTLGADFVPGFAFGRWALEGEQAVARAELPWTVVRPNSYMDNFAGMFGPGRDGVLRLPWADGATSFVDTADVAAVVAAVALDPAAYIGAVYEPTGPRALTCQDIVEALSASTDSTVRYVHTPVEEMSERMIAAGAPPVFVNALDELHRVMATRARARVTDHVARLTGKPPRSLAEWAAAKTLRRAG